MAWRGVYSVSVLSFVLCLAVAADAVAFTVLTTNKVLRFRESPGSAMIRVVRDPALQPLVSPLCPAESSVQLTTYQNYPEPIELPCANWTEMRDGYLYRDRHGEAGGVRRIRYRSGTLKILLKGENYAHVEGPDAFAEARFSIDSVSYVARFHDLVRNDAEQIKSRRPSKLAAQGEALFWATLIDDPNYADAAIEVLEKAVEKRKRDGRSWFLKGMMHLRRYPTITPDPHAPDAQSKAELAAATEAFDRAAGLIEHDQRLVGFRGAAAFSQGYANDDPNEMERGLTMLREGFALDPLFNVFSFIGTVAATVDASDPLFAESILYLEQSLEGAVACFVELPEVCSDEGFARHNNQGTFMMFGDLFAKAGDADQAMAFYNFATSAFFASWPTWNYKDYAQSRKDNLAANMQLWADGDPTNDPPISGAHGYSACIMCHHR